MPYLVERLDWPMSAEEQDRTGAPLGAGAGRAADFAPQQRQVPMPPRQPADRPAAAARRPAAEAIAECLAQQMRELRLEAPAPSRAFKPPERR